ncbi:MAG: YabP/YqfC family sporulation protein [Clostridia bacterium]|nr:YabP/YqfC family sporulation protein [Clostridia bacterium]
MSVLDKIKDITDTVEALTKENTVVTITGDVHMIIENYISIKLFSEDKLLVELDGFDLLVSGKGLVIEFFSPSRLVLTGTIKNISYLSDGSEPWEEL